MSQPTARAQSRPVLIVFAKRPAPGEVKTRMCPPFQPDEAADLYAAMLDDVLEASLDAARAVGAEAWLLVHPASAARELTLRCPPGFRVLPQRGADLAERMTDAVATAAAAGFGRILLRGSDSPALPVEHLVDGFRALVDVDLVVGPDRDGGYSWIGVRRPTPGLFDHPMSTSTVLEDTLANAAAVGWTTRRLAAHFDFDTAEDLAHWLGKREAGGAEPCPRTLAWLESHTSWQAHRPT
ncbi:MAG: TIGR04282 family arsenosugar biosynthesis glycosyltransferase [Myxococcota bacterium]